MKTRGKWGVTHGPTHARLWQLLLWWSCELMGLQVKRNSLSQTLTVNILLLSTPHKYGFDFPFTLFHVFSPYVLFTVFLRTSRFVAFQSNSTVDYYPLFCAFWTVCVEQWEEIASDYFAAADNWLRYLSFVCSGQENYKCCWATGLTITPHLARWWDRNKRCLDQLKIPPFKII